MAGRMQLIVCCALGKKLALPPASARQPFWANEADYAIRVVLHHYRQLSASVFRAPDKVKEVGPGRNVGRSLLMWALNRSRSGTLVTVILWDVFPHMVVDVDVLRKAARVF
jgi:hypothetical protein